MSAPPAHTDPSTASPRRVQLDFLAVGPQRTGTTWIYDYLVAHPQVCVSTRVKESFFFNREYERGLDWYWSLFRPTDEHWVCGEVAPTYFHSAAVTARVQQLSPACTVLVSLRDPVARLVSLYRHRQRLGEIAPGTSIAEALAEDSLLLESSRYTRHLKRWYDSFASEQIHLLRFEELEARPAAFAGAICDALGVERWLGGELDRIANPSVEPRSHGLQRVATQLNRSARRLGLHGLVRGIKATGLNRLLLRPAASRRLARGDLDRVIEAVAPEAAALAAEFGVDISPWTSAWQRAGSGR